ncbi:uncharacterized protein LOC142505892 [Primulina tabacum]|uniref:uncharacterized protein LOC142505892 n=1 Tax=Primulina tabacum TaxID=48773 RepID=UPI003F5ACDF0
MADEIFDEKSLSEKLSKLNSSQQSIESLSRWCISHRKKAKQVVETWDRLFQSVQQDQRVSFLYLANDILQNSRRKGSEFVNEFWKILPSALRGVYDSGDENCRKAASRLVDIWEERKVFGSRGQNLKNELLGKTPPPNTGKNPSLISSGKNSNPIKVVKRDAHSLRIKLTVGGMPEKILTSFHLIHDEVANEDAALNKCRSAISSVQEIEIDAVNASSQGDVHGSVVIDNIEKQENMLHQCISQLEKCETIRVALVSQLRGALQDQESKLELIQSELQAARVQIEKAANIKLQLASASSAPPVNQPIFSPSLSINNLPTPPPSNPFTSFVNSIDKEESQKLTAAAVAAKLTASSSSALMFTSVLSSFVAEEAASKSSGLKRPKLDTPISFSGFINPEGNNSAYFPSTQQASTNMPSVQSLGAQSVSELNPLQAPFLPPPPAPPPLATPANVSGNPLIQSTMMGLPFNYGASNIQLSSNAAAVYIRPGPPPQQAHPQLQNQQAQSQQQQPTNGGYFRPPAVGFYAHSHQPTTPPIHKQ